MPPLHSTMVPLGTVAHDFELHGTEGKTYSLNSFVDKEIIVIIFMCNHCPYVKAVLKRLIDLQVNERMARDKLMADREGLKDLLAALIAATALVASMMGALPGSARGSPCCQC